MKVILKNVSASLKLFLMLSLEIAMKNGRNL